MTSPPADPDLGRPTAGSPTSSAPAGSSLGRLRRRLVLGLLSTEAEAGHKSFRGLAVSGALLCVSGLASLLALAALGQSGASDLVALRLLAYASWLYGGYGLWALLAPADGTRTTRLAALRGVSLEGSEHFGLGVGYRITRGVVLSMLPIFLLAASLLPPQLYAPARFLLVPFVLGYALALGVCLAVLAGVVRRYWPRAPRAAALGFVLIPFVASWAWPGVPSIPGLFGSLISGMADLGGQSFL